MADPASIHVERASLSSLPYDILYQIFSDLASSSTKSRYIQKPWSSLSQTCRHLRDATLPEMFKNLAVSGNWIEAVDRLEDLQKHPNLLIYVRYFRIDVHIKNPDEAPPPHMPGTLFEVISIMVRLQRLEIVIPEDHTAVFEIALQQAKIDLSKISSLTLGPRCDFVLASCPNIEILSSNTQHWLRTQKAKSELDWIYDSSRAHFLPMISAASKCPNLSHLVLDNWWTTATIEAVVATMPKLQCLDLEGCRYEDGLSKLLPLLSQLTYLRCLSLPEPQYLEIGFRLPEIGSIRCSNRAGMRKYFEAEREKATAKVAKTVFSVCKANLEALWIGGVHVLEVVRDENGNPVQTKWYLEDAEKAAELTDSDLTSQILMLDGR